ncbi:MAG TPA: hypothetical protein VHY76_02345 [Acetobacteraceae bacterium]|nr:hypothetical protein [Acetobacteraceae bacterium]
MTATKRPDRPNLPPPSAYPDAYGAAPLTGRARALGRILDAGEAALYHDAAGALAAARQEAERLRATALESAAAIRRQAEADGRARGDAEAGRLLAGTASRTLSVLHSLREAIAEAIAAGVAQVIGTLDLDTAVAAAASHAVAQLRDRARVVVRVSPARVDAVRTSLAQSGLGQSGVAANSEACRVVADATLAADDCVIETAAGFIRAGLTAQLAVLRAALVRGARPSSGPEGST